MKKLLLGFIAFLLFSGNFNNANAKILDTSDKTEETNQIDLAGNLTSSKKKSLFLPIQVLQYSEYLESSFIGNLGVISVRIVDESNYVIY